MSAAAGAGRASSLPNTDPLGGADVGTGVGAGVGPDGSSDGRSDGSGTLPAPLAAFVAAAHDHDIAVHSLEVSVHGALVCSAGAAPFGPHVPHRMYSVAKSLTGLLVHDLAHAGALALTDRVVDHFPEMGPVHPFTAETRISHLLAMAGPHARTTYKADAGDWLGSWFRVAPTHRPGTLFTYDTSGSYVLSALVERTLGTSLEDAVRTRLLAPLGLGSDLQILPGPDGIGHGGSGLVCRPHDLLVLTEALNAGGIHESVRILPEEVVSAALTRANDPAMQTWGAELRAGYASQIWLPPTGGWMMFGLGGQVVFGDPARGLAAVVTSNAQACSSGDQRLVGLFLEAVAELADSPALPFSQPEAVPGSSTPRPSPTTLSPSGPVPVSPATTLPWPTPPHATEHARRIAGTFTAVTGESRPSRIALDLDAERVLVSLLETRVEILTDRLEKAEVDLVEIPGQGLGTAVAGWCGPGVLDVRIDVSAEEITRIRLRIVVDDSADGNTFVTVQSQGFGPEVDAAWTFFGTYAAATAEN